MRRIATIVLGSLTLLWIAYTLYAIGRFGGAVLADLDTTSRIMSVRNGDVMHDAIGLTYHGLTGAVLVVVEMILVLGAAVAALRSNLTLRRLGLVGLCGWTALWFGNALHLQTLGFDRLNDVLALGGAVALVAGWSALRWGAGAPRDRATAGSTIVTSG